MIVKTRFNLARVFWNIRYEALSSVGVAALCQILHRLQVVDLALPWSISAILGSALAIFIAFRNQSSYGRWWEARTLWGQIVNTSRISARQLLANTRGAVAAGQAREDEASAFAAEMIMRHIAFAHALRLHLRRQESWEELRHLLPESEFSELLQRPNKPNHLLLTLGLRVREGIGKQWLGGFDNISMEPNLSSLNNAQGACERIKNTPLPMNYQYFTRLFLYVFIFVLPFGMVGDLTRLQLDWMLVPVSFLVSFVFAVMNRVGEINENPFENAMQDVPMTALCNTIERDLLDMMNDKNLPEKTQAVDGYIY